MLDFWFLCLCSLIAGFVDAAVGGGGLIQLPAALLFLPGIPVPTALGTNKFASFFGTSTAVQRYARHVKFDWSMLLPSALAAFVAAFFGALIVTKVDPGFLRPLVLVLLVVVAVYVFFVKDLGLVHAPKHPPHKARFFGILIGAALGFYDGFFGPGTGSFLIFAFVGIFGFDFLSASASAKAINWSTNVASLIFFVGSGHVLYRAGLAMAACNIAGAFLGSHMAIAKGSRFVRVFFLIIVCALIAKLGQTLLTR